LKSDILKSVFNINKEDIANIPKNALAKYKSLIDPGSFFGKKYAKLISSGGRIKGPIIEDLLQNSIAVSPLLISSIKLVNTHIAKDRVMREKI